MPDVAFVMVKDAPSADLVAAVRTHLARQGMTVSVHETFPDPDPARLFVLVDPVDWVRARGERALPADMILRRTVFLSAADPALIPAQRALYARAGRVFDAGADTRAALKRSGIAARPLRPGHHPEWDRVQPVTPRAVGVTFAGVPTPQQSPRLERIAAVLAHRGIALRTRGERNGAARRAALAESRIALVLRRGADSRVAMLGVVEAIHSGAVVVAEPGAGLEPLVPGEHLFTAAIEALPWVAEALLRDDARLQRVRGEAIARLRTHQPLAASVAVLRVALLELLGRPLARS